MRKEPLHKKISDELRSHIHEGVLAVDEKISSENELCEQYEVSRLTVRRALQTLEQEGLIYRCQGLGAFVKDQQGSKELVHLSDFEEDMIGAGLKPSSVVVQKGIVTPDEEILKKMNLEPGTKVYQLDRLRLGNDHPVAYDTTWLPIMYGQLIDDEDMGTTTIYKILEQKYQIQIESGKVRMEAVLPNEFVAKQLDVSSQTPLMMFSRYSFARGSKLIYYQERYMRNDKMAYEIQMERSDDSEQSGPLPLKGMKPVFSS